MIKLSIVMPVYNAQEYLKDSIEAILNQSFKEFELILVDDGSTDRSLEICRIYEAQDSRIRVVHKENEGSGAARNVGIKLAVGKYITFPDSDDVVKKDMYMEMYNKIEEVQSDLIICNYETINSGVVTAKTRERKDIYLKEKKSCEKYFLQFRKESVLEIPWNKFYRLDIIRKHNIAYKKLKRAQDAVFNCNYYEHIKSCYFLDKDLYLYRENNISEVWRKYPEDFIEILLYVNELYTSMIKKWGLFDKAVEQYLLEIFFYTYKICLLKVFDENVKSLRSRYQQMKILIENEKVQQNVRIYNPQFRYYKILCWLIKKKSVLMTLLFTRIVIWKDYRR